MTKGNGPFSRKVRYLLDSTTRNTDNAPYFQNFTLVLISSAAVLSANIQNRPYHIVASSDLFATINAATV